MRALVTTFALSLLASCSSPSLDALPARALGVIVDWTKPPALIVNLTFAVHDGGCAAPRLTVDADGVPLAPAFTDVVGTTCVLGFSPAAELPATSTMSTVRVSDAHSIATMTAPHLLDHDRFAASVPAGSIVHSGDAIDVTAALAGVTYESRSADVVFVNGAARQSAATQELDDGVRVLVPALAAGAWTLHITATTDVAPVSCTNLTSCGARVTDASDFALVIAN